MNKTLGELVARAMERKGIRGYQLAQALGKQASFVSRLVNDEIKEVLPPADLESRGGATRARLARA